MTSLDGKDTGILDSLTRNRRTDNCVMVVKEK